MYSAFEHVWKERYINPVYYYYLYAFYAWKTIHLIVIVHSYRRFSKKRVFNQQKLYCTHLIVLHYKYTSTLLCTMFYHSIEMETVITEIYHPELFLYVYYFIYTGQCWLNKSTLTFVFMSVLISFVFLVK